MVQVSPFFITIPLLMGLVVLVFLRFHSVEFLALLRFNNLICWPPTESARNQSSTVERPRPKHRFDLASFISIHQLFCLLAQYHGPSL